MAPIAKPVIVERKAPPDHELGYHEKVRDLALTQAIKYQETLETPMTNLETLQTAALFEQYFRRGIEAAENHLKSNRRRS